MTEKLQACTAAALNLHQKLVEIRKKCKYLKKNASGFGFTYVDEESILSGIRDEMDEQRVLLYPHQDSLEAVDVTTIEKKVLVSCPGLRATYFFKWVNADDPTQEIVSQVIVQDNEQNIATCGSLLTYATRYFLLKFLNIPTGKSDPDLEENKRKKEIDPVQTELAKPTTLTADMIRILAPLFSEDQEAMDQCEIYYKKPWGQMPAAAFPSFLKKLQDRKNKRLNPTNDEAVDE